MEGTGITCAFFVLSFQCCVSFAFMMLMQPVFYSNFSSEFDNHLSHEVFKIQHHCYL